MHLDRQSFKISTIQFSLHSFSRVARSIYTLQMHHRLNRSKPRKKENTKIINKHIQMSINIKINKKKKKKEMNTIRDDDEFLCV